MGTPEVFADYLGVTVPRELWPELRRELAPEFEGLGMGLERQDDKGELWRVPDATGTVHVQRWGAVIAINLSGSVLAGLRLAKRMGGVLLPLHGRPHRVTRLDAALDLPTDAATVVAAIAKAGREGALALTRKRIPPATVETHLGLRCDGVESGTVYCGGRGADARMVVYDKRKERMDRKLPDIGNLTRYELRLRSGVGVSLGDVVDPAPVFWHHVSPDFLPRPDGVREWSPTSAEMVLERPVALTPAQRMYALLDRSSDVRSLLSLADQVGPYGMRLLVQRLESLAAGSVKGSEEASANAESGV